MQSITKHAGIALSIIVGALAGILAADTSIAQETITSSEAGLPLRSASELDYPPFATVHSDGSAGGFSVELLEAVAAAIGRPVTFEVGAWNDIKRRLTDGSIDVLPLVSRSPERDEGFDFTEPYLHMHGSIFVRRGDKSIRGKKDLPGREILVMRGDTSHEYAVREGLTEKLVLTDSVTEALTMLSEGKHDAVIVPAIVGLQIVKKAGLNNIVMVKDDENVINLKPTCLSPVELFEQEFCIAVKDGDGRLIARLNEGLAIVVANGTYDELYNKWFTPVLSHSSVSTAQLFKYVGLLLVPILFIVLSGGLYSLKHQVEKKTRLLRQSKNEWKKTFDAMTEIVTVQDTNMRIVRANKAAFDLLESASGGLVGKYCYEVFRGSSMPCPECPELDTIKDIQNHAGIIKHENLGKVFHVSTAPILNSEGELSHVVHVAKDITDQKKLEEDLFQAHKMEAMGTLAGGIAHDFNNILAALFGYTELAMLDIHDPPRALGNLREVLTATQRAKHLVKQILAFSRKDDSLKGPLSPHLILKESLQLLRASLPSTVEIHDSIDDSKCGLIFGNPTRIQQVIVNLCANALHAMESEEGILTIKLAHRELGADEVAEGVLPGSFVEIGVSDTGCGMSEDVIKHIFEPYYTTKGLGGTGMGLAIVYGIVQEYGGMIKVDSEPGQGTAFTILFPEISGEVCADKEEEEVSLPSGTEHILTVDDEKSITGIHKTILGRLGYEVTAMNSSREALHEFQSSPDAYDLVITDQTMPGMAGHAMAREMIRTRSDIPVILCTGYSSIINEEKARAIGIVGYAPKPVERKSLAFLVRKALDGRGAFGLGARTPGRC